MTKSRHLLFAPDLSLSEDAFRRSPANSYYVGGGFGYELSKKWELNDYGRLNINDSKNNTINTSDMTRISNQHLITGSITDVQKQRSNYSISQSIAVKYKIDSAASELRVTEKRRQQYV